MDERAAAYVTDILAGRLGATKGDVRVAIKTGTSYGYRDAWAMGYDGRYVVEGGGRGVFVTEYWTMVSAPK